jgi:peptidoglycan/LPS O-acetylase OafA/YrhL
MNNFDAVRVGLSLIVVLAHVVALTDLLVFNSLGYFFDSNFAVKGFFAISGFLVAKSYCSSGGLYEYFEKRFRRIYPAYFFAIVFCFFSGFIVSGLSGYEFVSNRESLRYLIYNAIFLNFMQPVLPNVFEANPVQAMNGSLWTIKIEVMLYFCIPIIIALFSKFGSKLITGLIVLFSISWVLFFTNVYNGPWAEEISRQFPGQLSYFVLGVFFAVNDKYLKVIWLLMIVSLFALLMSDNNLYRTIINPFAYVAIVLFVSTVNVRFFKLSKIGDVSYGIYLYHFPIIQLLVHYGVFENPLVGLFCALTFTLLAAFFSWHFVEKPMLKRSSHYVASVTC